MRRMAPTRSRRTGRASDDRPAEHPLRGAAVELVLLGDGAGPTWSGHRPDVRLELVGALPVRTSLGRRRRGSASSPSAASRSASVAAHAASTSR